MQVASISWNSYLLFCMIYSLAEMADKMNSISLNLWSVCCGQRETRTSQGRIKRRMTKFQEQRTFKLAVTVYRVARKEDFSNLKISISREFGKKIRKNNPLSLSSNKIPFNKVKFIHRRLQFPASSRIYHFSRNEHIQKYIFDFSFERNRIESGSSTMQTTIILIVRASRQSHLESRGTMNQ